MLSKDYCCLHFLLKSGAFYAKKALCLGQQHACYDDKTADCALKMERILSAYHSDDISEEPFKREYNGSVCFGSDFLSLKLQYKAENCVSK